MTIPTEHVHSELSASYEPPLNAPYYGAGMMTAVARFWKKYATFSGRASLSEFWFATLANAIVSVALIALLYVTLFVGSSTDEYGQISPGPLFPIFPILVAVWYLATLIPTLAIIWRRLHDTNRSGGFYFLSAIPFVGNVILLVLLALSPEPAGARFDR